MNEQPKALRLAGILERPGYGWHSTPVSVAYELRRLYAVNVELLDALQTVVANAPDPYCAITRAVDAQCRAAIAKATGER